MIKPAHDTHARILSDDVQIVQHVQTNDLDQIVALRDNNPDCIVVVSGLAASKLPAHTDDLSRLFSLVDHPDQDTLNQPFDALFRPVVAA
jgi:hypothetical protein